MLTNNIIVNNKLNKNEYREEHMEAGDSRPNPQQRSSQKAVVTGYFNASNQSNTILGKLNEGFHNKSHNHYKSR